MDPSLTQRNFVAPAPTPPSVRPRAEIIRREDILDAQRALLATYAQQQSAMLADVQSDVSRGGYVSSADLAAERRRTSAMYLVLYASCAGAAMGGLTLLGTVAVGWQPLIAVASWLAGTALATIFMAWRRHGQELEHSPEGIARHLLDWHGEVVLFEADTRRAILEREHELALLDRRQAADAAAAQRQLAVDLAAAQERRRRPVEAPGWAAGDEGAQPPTMHNTTPLAPLAAAPSPAPTSPAPTAAPSAEAALLAWASGLFDGGKLTADGVVLDRVPWSARSTWAPADRDWAADVCTRRRPVLFVQSAGGRWRLRLEVAGNAAQLLALLAQRGRQ